MRIVKHFTDPARKFDLKKDGPPPQRFADERAGSILLEPSDTEQKFELVISHSEKAAEGEVQHDTRADLRETDRAGKASQHRVLYEKRSIETID